MREGDGVLVLRSLRLANPGRRNARGKLVTAILGDDDEREIVSAAIERDFDNEFANAGAAAVGAGSFTDFLQWILDHQEELIAFIKKIMELFNPPVPVPEN